MIGTRASARAAHPKSTSSRVSAPSSQPAPASPLRARRGPALRGRFRPPGDKSISHRAFIFGLLACGETMVEGLLEGDDVLRTGEACKALGAAVERLAPGRWRIRGPGIGALLPPRATLDFGNAGTGSRLMMGVVGGHGITATFDGDAIAAQAPDGPNSGPAAADGGRGPVAGGGRALPDRAEGRPRPGADPLQNARRLGADQVGRAARRPQRPRRDDGHRGRGLARPHREDADPLRGRGHGQLARAKGAGSTSSAVRSSGRSPSSSPPTRLRRPSPSSPR